MRLKALWINGQVGKEFSDIKGVALEAERQGRKILGCKKVRVLDLISKPDLEGFVALVCNGSVKGGSNALGGLGQEKRNEE